MYKRVVERVDVEEVVGGRDGVGAQHGQLGLQQRGRARNLVVDADDLAQMVESRVDVGPHELADVGLQAGGAGRVVAVAVEDQLPGGAGVGRVGDDLVGQGLRLGYGQPGPGVAGPGADAVNLLRGGVMSGDAARDGLRLAQRAQAQACDGYGCGSSGQGDGGDIVGAGRDAARDRAAGGCEVASSRRPAGPPRSRHRRPRRGSLPLRWRPARYPRHAPRPRRGPAGSRPSHSSSSPKRTRQGLDC